MACAGALATAVLLSGAGAGIAFADPDDSPSADGASAPGDPDGGTVGGAAAGSDGGGESTQDKEPPPSTVGNGREEIDEKPARGRRRKKPAAGWGWPKFKHSLSIPILRLPTQEEITAGGLLNPEMYFGSIDVPVPSIDGFLSTLSEPPPEPTPQPSFRTQQEAPVLDITGNGGGYDPMAAETGTPPVYQLPMVVAPAIPVPGSLPGGRADWRRGRRSARGIDPRRGCGRTRPADQRVVATEEDAARTTLTPMSGNATRVGYSRYLRNPTTARACCRCAAGCGRADVPHLQRRRHRLPAGQQRRFIRTSGADALLAVGPSRAAERQPPSAAIRSLIRVVSSSVAGSSTSTASMRSLRRPDAVGRFLGRQLGAPPGDIEPLTQRGARAVGRRLHQLVVALRTPLSATITDGVSRLRPAASVSEPCSLRGPRG